MWDTTGTPSWKNQGSLSPAINAQVMTDTDIENLWENA